MGFVQNFRDGNRDMRELLGGKGANLAEMTRLGLPVPPGFTITTDACREYLATGAVPVGVMMEVDTHLQALEADVGRTFGDMDDPLLVSVRSGSAFSMPGMMDTILNVGLNSKSVAGFVTTTGNARFAWDCYRRLLQMYGRTVTGINGDKIDAVWRQIKRDAGVTDDADLDAAALEAAARAYEQLFVDETGAPFPSDPTDQLRGSILAVFSSWNGRRARDYRRIHGISDSLGTAVNVQAMVFGNRRGVHGSGTGVAFTRSPNTGERSVLIDFLEDAQGEDVVAGIRRTEDAAEYRHRFADQAVQLDDVMTLLEKTYRDACDLEFTIEDGRLWLLQTRVAKRAAKAAVRMAVEMEAEGLIDRDEALMRVDAAQISQLLHPRFDPDAHIVAMASGVAASPGAATGVAVFDSDEAERRGANEDVILVREVTSPEDLHGMVASRGILTAQGGNLSHAAIVAKGLGIPAVCGAAIYVDAEARMFSSEGATIREGDVISIDGTSGVVVAGEVPVVTPELDDTFRTLLGWADDRRRLGIRANADLPEDCRRARSMGAEGVGLCRTEHMFLGDRLPLLRRFISAETDAERRASLAPIRERQKGDFVGILEAMDGLPVTIRLLDPPLHEFLPDLTELAVKEATGEANGEDLRLLATVRRLAETNPMLGLRGIRLGLVYPELYRMQVGALADATAERLHVGGSPHPEIMLPLVADSEELVRMTEVVLAEWTHVLGELAEQHPAVVGTMIELPRAALTAGEIAKTAEFFSFGTNDLTQTTWGFSRDDAEAVFLRLYLEKGVLAENPFETVDIDGVGKLVADAVVAGRAVRPGIQTGVCGEHGGDPKSVQFFAEAGLDYVSMSPLRLPAARLAAAQAAIREDA